MGPGFSTVPAKLVNQIIAGKYIDLSELLAANLDWSEQETQLLLTAPTTPQCLRIEDIAVWVEAFTIFSCLRIRIKASKTDPFRKGCFIHIAQGRFPLCAL